MPGNDLENQIRVLDKPRNLGVLLPPPLCRAKNASLAALVFSFPRTSGVGKVLRHLPFRVNDRNHPHEHHGEHSRPPRWRRVHHSWIFWVAVFLMLLGIVTYVMTGDLFWALHRR